MVSDLCDKEVAVSDQGQQAHVKSMRGREKEQEKREEWRWGQVALWAEA